MSTDAAKCQGCSCLVKHCYCNTPTVSEKTPLDEWLHEYHHSPAWRRSMEMTVSEGIRLAEVIRETLRMKP